MVRGLAALVVFVGATARAEESVLQPAESARSQAADGAQPGDGDDRQDGHLRSWEAPAEYRTVVTTPATTREAEPIGDYGQPRWSARRRFPTTRIYVVPEGTLNLEYWYEAKVPTEEPREVRTRSQFELEFGLGHRLQLDVYFASEQKGVDATMRLHREKVELRYALADWGVLPANPTLYLELVRQSDAPPKAELKLLLGDQLSARSYWGVNLVFERELGAVFEHEYALTAAMAYTVLDQVLSVGGELKLEGVDHQGDRFALDEFELLAGPSVQWRPTPPVHLDLVGLVGAGVTPGRGGADSEVEPLLMPMFVVGYEL